MSKIMSKIVMVFVVMNLIGIAVALFLESGLGSDSVGLLCDGIRHTFLISFGNASLFYNLLIILIACHIQNTSIILNAGTDNIITQRDVLIGNCRSFLKQVLSNRNTQKYIPKLVMHSFMERVISS